MLWTIAVILIILWLLRLVSSYTMGEFIPHRAADCGKPKRLRGDKTMMCIRR
jgi:hypothetical protein